MERPKNITDKRTALAIRLIIIFHLVGSVGLSVPISKPFFLKLVPYHLLLMMLVLFLNHKKVDVKFIFFFLLIFLTGFGAEWLGVHTGILFGTYTYGDVLGLKLDAVPLIIGINWFMLIYAAGTAMQQTPVKSIWLRPLAGALILVLLDLVLEPVAVKFNYWHWAGNIIPVTNYICWFALSMVLLFIFELCRFKKQTIVGTVLLVSQFIFFLALLSQ